MRLQDLVLDPSLHPEIQRLQKMSTKIPLEKYLEHVRLLARKYPQELYLQTKYAAILGDWGQTLNSSRERKIKAKAAVLLSKLLKKLRNAPYPLKCYVRNEYYYHSGQPFKQYQLGVERLKKGSNGHFSAGVGASLYAYDLFLRGQIKKAYEYGHLSFHHWSTFEHPEKVGGPFFALSLALSRSPTEARAAFKKTLKADPYGDTLHQHYYEKEERRLEALCTLLE